MNRNEAARILARRVAGRVGTWLRKGWGGGTGLGSW